jgi:hypothetical protein
VFVHPHAAVLAQSFSRHIGAAKVANYLSFPLQRFCFRAGPRARFTILESKNITGIIFRVIAIFEPPAGSNNYGSLSEFWHSFLPVRTLRGFWRSSRMTPLLPPVM